MLKYVIGLAAVGSMAVLGWWYYRQRKNGKTHDEIVTLLGLHVAALPFRVREAIKAALEKFRVDFKFGDAVKEAHQS